jgi:cytochrome c nitrite reductase small subunit
VRAPAAVVIGSAFGLLLGLGGYTFIYARGGSYFTDRPEACVNCHVMQEQYDGWQRSSHRSVAVCNSCHTPAGFVGKYTTKALNGFWHSFYFTTGTFPDPIRITPRNARVTEGTCLTCHAGLVHGIEAVSVPGEPLGCVSCHRNVGHAH